MLLELERDRHGCHVHSSHIQLTLQGDSRGEQRGRARRSLSLTPQQCPLRQSSSAPTRRSVSEWKKNAGKRYGDAPPVATFSVHCIKELQPSASHSSIAACSLARHLYHVWPDLHRAAGLTATSVGYATPGCICTGFQVVGVPSNLTELCVRHYCRTLSMLACNSFKHGYSVMITYEV